ncbi:MAG TPA: hypothetical protein HA227_01765, partial [Candidatus Diapherotrites archaeon]|nr:hypothetical protein [Candidatus Diapherotrites archaeon]
MKDFKAKAERQATRIEDTNPELVRLTIALLKGRKVRLPNGKVANGKELAIKHIPKIVGIA